MVLLLYDETKSGELGLSRRVFIYIVYLVIYLACAVMRSNAWKCMSK